MLHVWATCNMAQSLCTRAFEPHHVIWLYVFAKYVSVLQISDTLLNNTTGRFFIPPVIFSNNIDKFILFFTRFALPSPLEGGICFGRKFLIIV